MTPGEERQSRSPVSASRALAAGVLEDMVIGVGVGVGALSLVNHVAVV